MTLRAAPTEDAVLLARLHAAAFEHPWGEAEIAWIDGNLKGFKGRATRDKWVAQAKLIGEVGIEEFLIRAKTNNY